MNIHTHSCLSDIDCASLYYCIEQVCQHKAFWPPTFIEIVGMLVIAFFSGFASLAGIGGGGVMVAIMTFFFNYSQKEALLFVFIPIFGAALGNFLNLVRHVDPQTKTPVVNIGSAILACPVMIVGSLIGIMINKFLSAFFLIVILEYFIGKSLIKFYITAKKEWKAEHERQTIPTQIELQTLLQQQEEIKLDIKGNSHVFIAALIIIITVVGGFLLRGSKEVNSIIGISYCGFGYWLVTIIVIFVLYKYFYIIDNKFNISKSPLIQHQFLTMSFKAGIMNGFGLGGGMFLIPMYLSFGYTTIQSTGTSSFNVLLSSFQAAAQVIILGLTSFNQAIQIFIMTLIGCYCSSSIIFTELKKRDRLSIIMWGLVGFCAFAMCSLFIEFINKWSRNGYQIKDLFNFQSLC